VQQRRRIERIDGPDRAPADDAIVDEAALTIEARGTVVATIMRTPGHDRELVRGLCHAEGVAVTDGGIAQLAPDRVAIDADPAAFAARGLVATAACGVCGREAIADLELRAREVASDLVVARHVIVRLPAALRSAQSVFDDTGGLHAAGLFAADGTRLAVREDVGRHNAVDKIVGWALDHPAHDPGRCILMLSGRLGFELVHKAVVLGVPIVAAVSAPTTLAIDVAERFRVAACGFVRGDRLNVYSHGWRVG
jgi:FdhD protein